MEDQYRDALTSGVLDILRRSLEMHNTTGHGQETIFYNIRLLIDIILKDGPPKESEVKMFRAYKALDNCANSLAKILRI